MSHTYKIEGELDKWDIRTLERVFARSGGRPVYGACRVMLEKLVIDGWLPAGNYLVKVSW